MCNMILSQQLTAHLEEECNEYQMSCPLETVFKCTYKVRLPVPPINVTISSMCDVSDLYRRKTSKFPKYLSTNRLTIFLYGITGKEARNGAACARQAHPSGF